jgi:hypothetical protein
MKITSRISFKDYAKLLFSLAYKKPMIRVILGVALLLLLWILGYHFHFLPVPNPHIYPFITLALIVVVQPSIIYLTIRQVYYSSNHLQEKLAIALTQEEIRITGESFYLKITWDKIFKIQETKHWYLIYQNNLSAVILHKKDFHGKQENDFRKILSTLERVPIGLKKEK